MSASIQTPSFISNKLPQQVFATALVNSKGLVDASSVWGKLLSGLFNSQESFLTGTHAQRLNVPASNYAVGSLFIETDRDLAYVATASGWVYFVGTVPATQATLPSDLGKNDANLLSYVQDFAHLLIWTGTGWTWAPAELGSDFILSFLTGPSPATGWQACDGSSNVPKLNFDGTLAFVTVPITANSFYRQ